MPKMEQPVSVITADKDPELKELNTGTRELDGKPSLTLSQTSQFSTFDPRSTR